jgi:hypothetical protein
MQLTFDYQFDWRAQAVLFRIGGGAAELAKEAVSLRLRQLVWLSLWGFMATITLYLRWWLPFALFAVFVLALVAHSFLLSNLGRKAAFGLRAQWRKKPAKAIRLEVSDEGLRETDGGVVSFAPWGAVKSYWVFRKVLCIELTNGLSALIPIATLACGCEQAELLIDELKKRGIHRREPVDTV